MGEFMAKKTKQKVGKKNDIGDVAWELFKRTGVASHYLFYKKLND